MLSKRPRSAALRRVLPVLSAGVITLVGCADTPSGPQAGAADQAAPIQLYSGRPTDAGGQDSVVRSLDKAAADKAIENYRINKGGEKSPYIYRAAELNGDGRPEILVYFTGPSWCAKTGCTLSVLTPDARGYTPVTTIRRVKLPVRVAEETVNGWRTLVVNTGGAVGPEQTVALKFTGDGYPGNATLMSPIKFAESVPGETLFAKGAAARTASAPAVPQQTSTP